MFNIEEVINSRFLIPVLQLFGVDLHVMQAGIILQVSCTAVNYYEYDLTRGLGSATEVAPEQIEQYL